MEFFENRDLERLLEQMPEQIAEAHVAKVQHELRVARLALAILVTEVTGVSYGKEHWALRQRVERAAEGRIRCEKE